MVKRLAFIVGLVLTLSLLWPLFKAPYFSSLDDVQIIRIYEMDKCIKDGQIPCRWVPDLGNMYGYPLFNYYAPLPYYFGEIFYLISGSITLAAKIMFATPFLGAFIFMYLLSKRLWGTWGGSLSGIFYSFAPYHALVFYVRGAMGEMWALMFFPAILWAVYRLKETSKLLYSILTGLFLGLLILSHNLSLMLFIPIFMILLLYFLYRSTSWRMVKMTVIALSLGVMLAAFYWLPMIVEKELVYVETTTQGYFGYTEHFKGVHKLLESNWGYGQSVREIPGGPPDGLSYQIGPVHLLVWILALFVAWRLWKKKRSLSMVIIISSLIIMFSIFMINPRSNFVWKIFDPLKYLQFPWRFLSIVILFISLIAGSVMLVVRNRLSVLIWISLVIGVIVLNFAYFKPEYFYFYTDQQFLQGTNWERQVTRSIYDFLPKGAEKPPPGLAQSRYQIIDGETTVSNFNEGTNWITFNTQTKNRTIIRLSQYDFPEWQVTVDGKPIKINSRNTYGLITFMIGEGNHQVTVRLVDTPIRTISNVVSILGFIFFIVLLLTQVKLTRKWILYYWHFVGR
ncbi:6-pyruvoyl-tetrahydropterin synthase-related protein [Patescibacteria group bacterium]|nr:6-pyruvoyl-tetrahydropterin synthase-related protein [Patescibacteria group bacterium]